MENQKKDTTEKKTDIKSRIKRILPVLAAILVALFFITGFYLSPVSVGVTPTSSTTSSSTPPPTTYGVATANASIIGYNNTLNLSIACPNSSLTTIVNTKLQNTLNKLENNNSIYNFYSLPNQTLILAGTMNTSDLFGFINRNFNSSTLSCVSFSAPAEILLPTTLNFYISGKTYSLPLLPSQRRSQITESLTNNAIRTVQVRVSALITNNGTIYSLSTSKIK